MVIVKYCTWRCLIKALLEYKTTINVFGQWNKLIILRARQNCNWWLTNAHTHYTNHAFYFCQDYISAWKEHTNILCLHKIRVFGSLCGFPMNFCTPTKWALIGICGNVLSVCKFFLKQIFRRWTEKEWVSVMMMILVTNIGIWSPIFINIIGQLVFIALHLYSIHSSFSSRYTPKSLCTVQYKAGSENNKWQKWRQSEHKIQLKLDLIF